MAYEKKGVDQKSTYYVSYTTRKTFIEAYV